MYVNLTSLFLNLFESLWGCDISFQNVESKIKNLMYLVIIKKML